MELIMGFGLSYTIYWKYLLKQKKSTLNAYSSATNKATNSSDTVCI